MAKEITDIDLLKIKGKIDIIILDDTKKRKNIVYGAQSIKKQTGVLGRKTFDFDIFSNNPKENAKAVERRIEKLTSKDSFYTKPAMHPGTWKVNYKGEDNKKGTRDDIGIADYTNSPKPKPPIKIINGIRYRTITQEAKSKRKALSQKEFKFRHEKDREDLERIKLKKVVFD